MNFEQACKILGCPTNVTSAKAVAAFTLRTATRQCPLKVKVAANFVIAL